VHDQLTDARYVWHGSRNFVQLDPSILPAHIFRVHPIG
jgi:starch synthase (maltosyl-transferring)